jgi:hypothetical protein
MNKNVIKFHINLSDIKIIYSIYNTYFVKSTDKYNAWKLPEDEDWFDIVYHDTYVEVTVLSSYYKDKKLYRFDSKIK